MRFKEKAQAFTCAFPIRHRLIVLPADEALDGAGAIHPLPLRFDLYEVRRHRLPGAAQPHLLRPDAGGATLPTSVCHRRSCPFCGVLPTHF